MALNPTCPDADTQRLLDLLTTARVLVDLRYRNTDYPAMTTALEFTIMAALKAARHRVAADE